MNMPPAPADPQEQPSREQAGSYFVTPPLKGGRPYVVPKLPWPLPGVTPPETPGRMWQSRWPDPPVPDEAACLALWEKYHMLPHIGRHSRVVADLAEALAGRGVEMGLLAPDAVPLTRAAGLLHDIAKSYCVRYGGSHAQIGASWVIASTGHRRLAQAVLHHVEWPWPVPEYPASGTLAPVFLVIYADKRTMHDTIVSLDERYDDLMIRYGKTEHSRAAIARGRIHASTIERALAAQLEFPLHESTVAGGRLVKRT